MKPYAGDFWYFNTVLVFTDRFLPRFSGYEHRFEEKKMHSLYITSFVRLSNEPEPDLHGNELRIDPVAGWVMDHHYELSDSGPIWTGEAGK